MGVKTVVSIVKTGSQPGYAEIEEAVRKAVALAGGLEDVVKPGNMVIIKPNVLCNPIDHNGDVIPGATTHPEICRALAVMVKELGARPVIAESSAVGSDTEKGYQKLGYAKLRDEGFEVVDLKRHGGRKVSVDCPKGKIFKDMTTWELVTKADVIISVPVMKNHDQAAVSLGLKNLKGLYTDAMKKRAHTRQLFQQVADWATVVTPKFMLVDGIIGQEGDGPLFGLPVEMNTLIAGKDPVATDAVTSAVMGYEPSEILITRYCAEHGLGTMDLNEIEIAGVPLEKARRRFMRVEEDVRGNLPDLRIIYNEDTCTGCRISFHSAVLEATANGFAPNLAGYTILTGEGEIPADVDPAKLITVGRCVPRQNRIGKAHVQGCPPNNLPQMRAMLDGIPEFEAYAKKRSFGDTGSGLDF